MSQVDLGQVVYNGLDFWSGTCSTSRVTAAKTVSCASFSLSTGSRIKIEFTAAASGSLGVENPISINVNNTGAKQVYTTDGTKLTTANTCDYMCQNRYIDFIYDGSYWRCSPLSVGAYQYTDSLPNQGKNASATKQDILNLTRKYELIGTISTTSQINITSALSKYDEIMIIAVQSGASYPRVSQCVIPVGYIKQITSNQLITMGTYLTPMANNGVWLNLSVNGSIRYINMYYSYVEGISTTNNTVYFYGKGFA